MGLEDWTVPFWGTSDLFFPSMFCCFFSGSALVQKNWPSRVEQPPPLTTQLRRCNSKAWLRQRLAAHKVCVFSGGMVVFTGRVVPQRFFLGGATFLGWWFQIFVMFHPYLGKWSNLTNIFQMGRHHQLVYHTWIVCLGFVFLGVFLPDWDPMKRKITIKAPPCKGDDFWTCFLSSNMRIQGCRWFNLFPSHACSTLPPLFLFLRLGLKSFSLGSRQWT